MDNPSVNLIRYDAVAEAKRLPRIAIVESRLALFNLLSNSHRAC